MTEVLPLCPVCGSGRADWIVVRGISYRVGVFDRLVLRERRASELECKGSVHMGARMQAALGK